MLHVAIPFFHVLLQDWVYVEKQTIMFHDIHLSSIS